MHLGAREIFPKLKFIDECEPDSNVGLTDIQYHFHHNNVFPFQVISFVRLQDK